MERFGKYEVVEKIGEGGFGEVYKGRDPTLKRFVAIKTCKAESRQFLDRFLLEAEISARLQHSNIVTIYDFGYQDQPGETPYLVQEYLAGEDLDRKIRRRATLDFATKADILRQAAVGLRHAHHRGIVHRDVKPANLRVLEDGLVKIMDFGIAKLLSSDLDLTQTGMTLGTARYQAPEQFQGDKIDLRADIFAFGVTAYELLTYEQPFDGDSVARIFYRIIHEPHQPITELWPDCPPGLRECIDQCLHKDPAHRYSDLAPVIGVLETFCAPVGSGSFAAMSPAPPGPPPPPPPPPPASNAVPLAAVPTPASAFASVSGATATLEQPDTVQPEAVRSETVPSETTGEALDSRAYDTALNLQKSRVGRLVAFAAVALLAFGLTYGAGRLLRNDGSSPDPGDLTTGVAPALSSPDSGSSSSGPSSEVPPDEPSASNDTARDAPAEPAARPAIIQPAVASRKPLTETRDPQTRDRGPVVDSSRPSPETPIPRSSEPSTSAGPLVTDPAAAPEDLRAVTPEIEPQRSTVPAVVPPAPQNLVQGTVILYQGRDFGGRGETFGADDPDLSDNVIGNDKVRSARVDPGCRVELFQDVRYQGRVTILEAHTADLRATEVGNREASSVRVVCRPTPATDGRGVELFVHGDFRGPSELVLAHDADLADNPIGDDSVSSVRVSPGCRARLFRKAGFSGRSTAIDGDVAALEGTEVGNDQVSSVEVECSPSAGS